MKYYNAYTWLRHLTIRPSGLTEPRRLYPGTVPEGGSIKGSLVSRHGWESLIRLDQGHDLRTRLGTDRCSLFRGTDAGDHSYTVDRDPTSL